MSITICRVLLRPLSYWIFAILIYWYLTGHVVDSFSENSILIGLAKGIDSAAKWAALVPFLIGAYLMLERLQLLHEWSTEPAAGCNSCGGPQVERTGRYGPYRKCFICQKNKKFGRSAISDKYYQE